MTLLFMARCPHCGSNLVDEQNTIAGYSCQSCGIELDESQLVLVKYIECE
jgi:DNA-directed RNA polymerase subunit RPC12/RpoP